jgi:hypothetical protein
MKTFFAIAISLELVSCAQSPFVLKQIHLQEDLLCQAYRTDSLQLLEQFFTKWQNNRLPLSRDNRARLSEIHQTVYQIFEDFINYEIEKYPHAYRGSPFCMIQNEIDFSVVDTSTFHRSFSNYDFSDAIDDFRPLPSSLHAKVVYVTPPYETILQNFIRGQCPGSGKRTYDQPWPGWPRASFLEQMVQLRASLGGFHIHTLPRVSVRLNSTLSQAVVYSYHGNISQSDLYKNAHGRWQYVMPISSSIE